MKKMIIYGSIAFVVIFSLIFIWKYFLWGETFKTLYENKLPPELPSDIPMVEGDIMVSGETVNVYGEKAYFVELETTRPFPEVVEFYEQEFRIAGNPGSISGGGENYSGNGQFGENELAVEIYLSSQDKTKTCVNIAVHMDAFKP